MEFDAHLSTFFFKELLREIALLERKGLHVNQVDSRNLYVDPDSGKFKFIYSKVY